MVWASRSSGSSWQGERERGPLADPALDPDPPPVQLHELLGQRQSEPGALLFAGIIPPDLAELLEDGRLVFGRNADACVADRDRDHALGRCGGAAPPPSPPPPPPPPFPQRQPPPL